ncbi:MAG: hypothetical protein CXR30_19385, partial [Geobacter sp.]
PRGALHSIHSAARGLRFAPPVRLGHVIRMKNEDMKMPDNPNSRRNFSIARPVLYACTLGIVGFISGYFGPIVLNPSANQGPLFGIFFTGPLGAIAGLILGVIVELKRTDSDAILPIAALTLAIFTLYQSLPTDMYQGFIIDAEVIGCEPPASFVSAAVERWDRIKSTPDYKLRPEWKSDVVQMVTTQKGAVLKLKVNRKRKIYEQRKPWNRGHLIATEWESVGTAENYFLRDRGSCSEIRIGEKLLYSPIWEESQVSPPDVLPTFLGFHTLQPVPPKFEPFAK